MTLQEALDLTDEMKPNLMRRKLEVKYLQELEQLIKEDGGAELTCHFCRAAHRFTRQDLTDLLERATK